MTLEDEYMEAALESLEPWLFLLPAGVVRKIRLARSVRATRGATAEELSRELGSERWAITQDTPAHRGRYGLCITRKQYEAAERRAIERREHDSK